MSKWQSWASSTVLGAFKPSSYPLSCLLLPAFHCPHLRYLTHHCVFIASSLIVVLGGRSYYHWEGKGSLGQAIRWIVPGHMAKVWQKPYWGRQSGVYLSTLVIMCSPVTRFSMKPSFWEELWSISWLIERDFKYISKNSDVQVCLMGSQMGKPEEPMRLASLSLIWGTATAGLSPLFRKELEIWVLTQTEEVACW